MGHSNQVVGAKESYANQCVKLMVPVEGGESGSFESDCQSDPVRAVKR